MTSHDHLHSLPTREQQPSELPGEAIAFAELAHQGQERKLTGEAMVTHPIGVAEILLTTEGVDASEATLIAALLHDTVEMNRATLDEIEQRFGREARDIVDGVTKRGGFATRELKLQDYLYRLEFDAPDESLLVALADKIHNIEDILLQLVAQGDDIWAFFKGGAEGTLQWHQDVLEIAERKLPGNPLTERLSADVKDLRTLLVGRQGMVLTAMAS